MQLTADEARSLGQQFHDAAVAVGNYRFGTPGLSPQEIHQLESFQWTLLNYSSDFATAAISIALADVQGTMDSLNAATTAIGAVVKKIETVDKVLRVAGSLAVLGAAIVTGNPGTIATAVGGVINVAAAKDTKTGDANQTGGA